MSKFSCPLQIVIMNKHPTIRTFEIKPFFAYPNNISIKCSLCEKDSLPIFCCSLPINCENDYENPS